MEEPEVGAVIDGFRFKGGDPAQESSWEQVSAIDASDNWGPGAVQLPNGSVVRYGPRGGATVLQSAAQANQGGSSALVGADARARFMLGLDALVEAERNLRASEEWEGEGAEARPSVNPFTRDWGARMAEAIRFDRGATARILGGQDYQDYEQAARTYESAMLPIFSGAAVTPTEAQRLIRADLPQFGDSLETLRRKAMNRAMRINAVAVGIGREAPYPEVGTLGVDGAVTPAAPRSDDEVPAAAPSDGAPSEPPTGPAAPDGPVDIAGMSAEELLALAPGTPIRLPDGTVTRLTGAPEIGASGDQVAPGVYARAQSPEEAVAERRDVNPALRRIDAAVRGAADMMSFGFADEIAAAGDTVIPLNGGVTGWQVGFPEAYRQNIARERAVDQADAQDVPVSRGAGQVAGAVAGGAAALRGASRLPNALRLQQGQRARNALRVGAGGGVAAGAGAAGNTEGGVVERGQNALAAAPVGAIAAPVAGAAVNALAAPIAGVARRAGEQINRGVQSLGRRGWDSLQPNPLAAPLERMAATGQSANALASRADELRAHGIDPTFADVTDSSGRGMIRALATRQTPAREAVEDFAEGRAEAMPSRVAFQARRTISDDARSPDQIREELGQARSAQADANYGAVRASVPVDEALLDAIADEPGKAAIRAARAGAMERRDMDTVQELDRLMQEVDLRGQLSGMGVNAGRMQGEGLSLSALTVERLRRALGERGGRFSRAGRNEQASGAFSRRDAVESVLDAVPDLAEARGAFREASQQIEAVSTGEQFLGQNTDEFVARVNAMTPEQRRLARAGAARAVELASQNPGRAPGVARSLYANPEQGRRADAMMGPEDSGRMAAGMRAEVEALNASRQINPRTGSPTNLNQQDTLAAAGEAIGAARDVATGNVPGLAARALSWARTRGLNDAEAEALARAAIDPARTSELIDLLSQRMTRRDARSLARAGRFAISQNLGEATVQ